MEEVDAGTLLQELGCEVSRAPGGRIGSATNNRTVTVQEIKQIGNSDLRRQLFGVIAKARGEGLSKDDNFPHLVSGDNPKLVDKPPTIFHLDPKADARHRLVSHARGCHDRCLSQMP